MSEHQTARRYAVISSDRTPIYMFYVPIVACAWLELGFVPLIVLERAPWTDTREAYVRASIPSGSFVVDVCPSAGYKVSTSLQTVRLLVSALPSIEDDDYVLTSDADMVPFISDYFRPSDAKFQLFGADAYSDPTVRLPPKFPLCYLGAKAREWRNVMAISTTDIDHELASALNGRADVWDNDEMYFASKIMNHTYFCGEVASCDRGWIKGQVHMIARGWECGRALKRLDRDAWDWNGQAPLIDCHGPRPGWNDKLLRRVIMEHFPQKTDFIAGYFDQFARMS